MKIYASGNYIIIEDGINSTIESAKGKTVYQDTNIEYKLTSNDPNEIILVRIKQVDVTAGLWENDLGVIYDNVAMLAFLRANTGFNPGSGGSGSVTEIESTDGSIQVTNPNGPIIDISVSAPNVNLTTFVDDVYGDDTTGEHENPYKPFKTIQAALLGSTVINLHVRPGDYVGPFQVPHTNLSAHFDNFTQVTGDGFKIIDDCSINISGNVEFTGEEFIRTEIGKTVDGTINLFSLTTTDPSKAGFHLEHSVGELFIITNIADMSGTVVYFKNTLLTKPIAHFHADNTLMPADNYVYSIRGNVDFHVTGDVMRDRGLTGLVMPFYFRDNFSGNFTLELNEFIATGVGVGFFNSEIGVTGHFDINVKYIDMVYTTTWADRYGTISIGGASKLHFTSNHCKVANKFLYLRTSNAFSTILVNNSNIDCASFLDFRNTAEVCEITIDNTRVQTNAKTPMIIDGSSVSSVEFNNVKIKNINSTSSRVISKDTATNLTMINVDIVNVDETKNLFSTSSIANGEVYMKNVNTNLLNSGANITDLSAVSTTVFGDSNLKINIMN